MNEFLVDPAIIAGFLDKPYDLRAVWNRVAHETEKPSVEGPSVYTQEERAYIVAEARRIYEEQTRNLPLPDGNAARQFKLSAGPSGSGKSTLLEYLIKNDPEMKGLVFCDPDERALKRMPAYYRDITAFGGGAVGLALSYTKWRWGSNWISNTMLNRAGREGRDILLGTTATSPYIHLLYENARRAGYETETLIVCAPEHVCSESSRRRFEEEGRRFTDDDAKGKGRAFYERLPDLLRHTDHLRLYWRDQVDAAPVLAATARNGDIEVHDDAAMHAIEKDLARNADIGWDDFLNIYCSNPRL